VTVKVLPRRKMVSSTSCPAARAGEDRGVDADQLPQRIDEGAAGVARVDGRIGLDEVLEGADAQARAPGGADDAHGHRLPHPEGVADGQHHVTGAQLVGVAQGDHRQILQLDAQHRQVRLRVGTHHLGARHPAVAQPHLDRLGSLDDMVVGEDEALVADDDPRTEARLQALPGDVRLIEEVAVERVVAQGGFLDPLGGLVSGGEETPGDEDHGQAEHGPQHEALGQGALESAPPW